MFFFTPRERQVVNLTVQGHSNKEIARELTMGLGTVKTHLNHIFEKASVRNRMGLALATAESPPKSQ